MEKKLERIINVLKKSVKPLTKVEVKELGGRANSSKLRLLLKMGIIKKNKIIIPNNPEDIINILEETKLIKNEIKREKVIAKLKAKASKEKFYYTFELV